MLTQNVSTLISHRQAIQKKLIHDRAYIEVHFLSHTLKMSSKVNGKISIIISYIFIYWQYV